MEDGARPSFLSREECRSGFPPRQRWGGQQGKKVGVEPLRQGRRGEAVPAIPGHVTRSRWSRMSDRREQVSWLTFVFGQFRQRLQGHAFRAIVGQGGAVCSDAGWATSANAKTPSHWVLVGLHRVRCCMGEPLARRTVIVFRSGWWVRASQAPGPLADLVCDEAGKILRSDSGCARTAMAAHERLHRRARFCRAGLGAGASRGVNCCFPPSAHPKPPADCRCRAFWRTPHKRRTSRHRCGACRGR